MELKQGMHVHFMGICGTAMASLAGLLQEKGCFVTGSDTQAYPPMSDLLKSLGIEIKIGYVKENLIPSPDLVIVGNVIMKKYEEAHYLIHSNIPYMSLPEALRQFVIENRQAIVVAGTHGKTSTTSMMAWVAEQAGQLPGFLIGGIPKNFNRSFQLSQGDFFVIEGDEYDTAFFDKQPKFVHYNPRHVILTSVEFDHADIYENLDSVKSAFIQLMKLIPDNGTLLAFDGDKNVHEVIQHAKCKNIYTYGKTGDFTYQVVKESSEGIEFDVYFRTEWIDRYSTEMIGLFNLHNSLSVIALSTLLGWNKIQIKNSLSRFSGVKRRQEVIGEPRGITIIEDFAHHPTAVNKTIEAVQQRYAPRRVFSVFEPRSATTRTNIFHNEYVDAFSIAQNILIAQPYNQSSIDEKNRFSTRFVCEQLKNQGVQSKEFNTVDEIISYLHQITQSGDVILIMSNGGFDGIYETLLKTLEK